MSFLQRLIPKAGFGRDRTNVPTRNGEANADDSDDLLLMKSASRRDSSDEEGVSSYRLPPRPVVVAASKKKRSLPLNSGDKTKKRAAVPSAGPVKKRKVRKKKTMSDDTPPTTTTRSTRKSRPTATFVSPATPSAPRAASLPPAVNDAVDKDGNKDLTSKTNSNLITTEDIKFDIIRCLPTARLLHYRAVVVAIVGMLLWEVCLQFWR